MMIRLNGHRAAACALAALFISLWFNKIASAHVTLADGDARAGSQYRAVIRVPHGCAGEATQAIRVQIPEGVIEAKPMPKPGWSLKANSGSYAKSYVYHGKPTAAGTREIIWSGGNLGDDNYDEFVFTAFIAPDVSSPLYFPTIQTCAGSEARWVDIPAAGQNGHDLKSPAPSLRVVAGSSAMAEMDHSGHGDMAMQGDDTFKVGDITVKSLWSRATPAGAKIAAGYLTVTNGGSAPDVFVGATTNAADRVEIHEMSVDGGVMKMRPLPAGLPLKPGETVELKPSGFHLMMVDIKQQLKPGDTVKATLKFEKAGAVDVTFVVNAMGATTAPAHKH